MPHVLTLHACCCALYCCTPCCDLYCPFLYLQKYMFTFKQAYAKALNLDAKDVKVGSLACDGRPVKAPAASPAAGAGAKPKAAAGSNAAKSGATGTPAQAAAPAPAPASEPEGPMAPVTWSTVKPPAHKRSLLDTDTDADVAAVADTDVSEQAASDGAVITAGRQLLAVKPAQAATPKPAVLTTEFSVPAPTDATERADLAATVMEMSPAILEAPMTQFFGRPVQVQPAVEQPPPQAAPKPASKPVPKAPAPAVAPSPMPAKAPKPPAKKQPKPSPSPLPKPQPPAAEAVPETPVEAPPMALPAEPPESPAVPRRPPGSVAPSFPQKPTGLEPGPPGARPVPTVPETPSPSPAPGGTWPSLLPISLPVAPQQPPRPRWPFGVGPQRPQPPPMPTPGAVGPEEATPVLVTLSPSPPPRPGTYPAPPQTQETFSWPSAPTCHGKPNGHTSTPDAEGRLWGYQDGRSCAFRTPNDQPITITWDNAVSCTNKPTTSNSVFDAQGRLCKYTQY